MTNGAQQDGMDEIKKKIAEAKKNEQKATEAEQKPTEDKLHQQIEELQKRVSEAESKALRALADLSNAKKRMEQEKASFAAFANVAVMLQVIEVYENYRRVIEHVPKETSETDWLKGLRLLDQQFQKVFETEGVQRMSVQPGEKVDPAKHEIVMSAPGAEGEILEIFSDGYGMKGRVIRAAKVKVGSGEKRE